ncbi:MAG: hypothetical protein ACPL3C_01010 [Pyrobaculum sp.]
MLLVAIKKEQLDEALRKLGCENFSENKWRCGQLIALIEKASRDYLYLSITPAECWNKDVDFYDVDCGFEKGRERWKEVLGKLGNVAEGYIATPAPSLGARLLGFNLFHCINKRGKGCIWDSKPFGLLKSIYMDISEIDKVPVEQIKIP